MKKGRHLGSADLNPVCKLGAQNLQKEVPKPFVLDLGESDMHYDNPLNQSLLEQFKIENRDIF